MVPDDRDRRREADPLHDTVDESTGVVRDAVDPDVTPLPKLLAGLEDELGPLTNRERRMVALLHGHMSHGRQRQADQILAVNQKAAAGGVDVDELRKSMAVDIANWQPFKGDRERLEKLEEAEAGRAKVLGGIRRYALAGLTTALVALGGGLIDYGRRQASGDSARDQAAADRQALIEQTAKNHAQDIEIGVLRALVRTLERNNRRTNGDD